MKDRAKEAQQKIDDAVLAFRKAERLRRDARDMEMAARRALHNFPAFEGTFVSTDRRGAIHISEHMYNGYTPFDRLDDKELQPEDDS